MTTVRIPVFGNNQPMAIEGKTLGGRYRLGPVLGRGGMSTVYRAEDLRLERTVAVKVMSAALAEHDPVSIARFEREARAAASLTHPGIATVYDTGVEGDSRYIVMELAPGRSLQTIIQQEAPLPPARAAEIAAKVADVLSVAHSAGIVHRDIKPGNVMVAANGSVKVLDFGIARASGGATLTQVHSVVGTVAFMSPEQAMGQPTDSRSDIYSLGCVLYAMLAAEPPFMAEVTAAVLHQHTSVPPRPLHEVAPNVPPALDALVMEMLAKDPAQRPQTAAEVRDRLRAALDPTAATMAIIPPAALEPTQIAPARPSPAALAGLAPAAAAAADEPPATRPGGRSGPPPDARRGSPGRGLAIAAIVLLLAVIAAVAAIALASGGGSSSNTGATTAPPTTTHPPTTTTPPTTTQPPTTTTQPTTTTTTITTTTTTPTGPTTTTVPTTTTSPSGGTPPGQGGTPPGQGGAPPGQGNSG
jgi:eukaryotic-like serine/threonine-protein kinase